MRLLHTTKLELKDYTGLPTPEYAIVSHRWGDDEVSYQALLYLVEKDVTRKTILQTVYNIPESLANGPGFHKINRMCSFASRRRFEWIWVDTCCINKESSAELSEAINSMYKWYQEAAICFVYLSDVHNDRSFQASKWFQRGWTLQELLAPKDLLFLDSEFQPLGTRNDFASQIAARTNIGIAILTGSAMIQNESVATRMSWAAGRTTTREEDIAYSLLGIFSVNMPLLYGEGVAAFRRLQEQIIQTSDDETIFAQNIFSSDGEDFSTLPKHPSSYCHSKRMIRGGLDRRFADLRIGASPFSVTNKGIQAQFPYVLIRNEWDADARVLLLNCHLQGESFPFAIPVTKAIDSDKARREGPEYRFDNVWNMRPGNNQSIIGESKLLINKHIDNHKIGKELNPVFGRETMYLK